MRGGPPASGACLLHREYERAREVAQDYLALARQSGYPWGMAAAHLQMYWVLVWSHMGAGVPDPESLPRLLREQAQQSLEIAQEHGLPEWQARARLLLAADTANDLPRAEALLREALQTPEGVPREVVQEIYLWLMCFCAWQGKWNAVAAALRQSIPFGGPGIPLGVRAGVFAFISAMDQGLREAGRQAEFTVFCEEARALYAQAGLPIPIRQWYMEPATPTEVLRRLLFRDDFEGPELRPEWL